MTVSILMPALSPTMTEGTLSRWFKREGDTVEVGDVIAEIETDKATMEIEAIDEGILGRIIVPEGSEQVPVNTVIAVLKEAVEGNSEEDDVITLHMDDAIGGDSLPVKAVVKGPSLKETNGVPIPARSDTLSISENTDVLPETRMERVSVRQALRDAMAEEMRRDQDVFLIGEEVAEYQGAYKVSQGLLEEFGEKRVIDTPITEQGFAGIGVGAAFAGLKPIVEFMTFNFAMQAIDQIVNSAAKTLYMSGGQISCPIVFRGPNGAASRVAAQHSQCFASWFAHIPGLKVVAPHSAADAKGLLKSAVRDPNPVIFLENEILYGQSSSVPILDDFTVPIGKARVVRPGESVTIIGYALAIEITLQAAEQLAAENIDAEIIDLRTLRPLDIGTVLESVAKTNRAVIVEEGWPVSNIGSEVSAQLMEQGFDLLEAPVARVTGKDVPMPYAANLEKLALPQADDVVQAARAVCYRN